MCFRRSPAILARSSAYSSGVSDQSEDFVEHSRGLVRDADHARRDKLALWIIRGVELPHPDQPSPVALLDEGKFPVNTRLLAGGISDGEVCGRADRACLDL